MKRKFLSFLAASLLVANDAAHGQLSSPFNTVGFQGRLIENGVPANGRYDVQAALFMTETNGTPCLGASAFGIGVSNGLLNVQFEFGDTAYPVWDGSNPPGFMEIAVRPQGSSGAFTTLQPRQRLGATPYAQSAVLALKARTIEAGSNQPLSMSIGSQTVLQIVGTDIGPTRPPSIIVGYSGNQVLSGSVGATISGGGLAGAANQVNGHFSTVAGGAGNIAGVYTGPPPSTAILPTGSCEVPNGVGEVVGGGGNNVSGPGDFATTGGGERNRTTASWATTAGGQSNITTACYAATGGGFSNWIQNTALFGVISGGDRNLIESNSPNAVVGGGSLNAIHAASPSSVIAGGAGNDIQRSSTASTIAGGQGNRSGIDSDFVFIGGGQANLIADNVEWGVIAGGLRNSLQPATDYSIIVGGHDNTIQTNASSSVLAGGASNLIGVNADAATLSGGGNNVVAGGALFATIGGGQANGVGATYAATGGGQRNNILTGSSHSVIAGGASNIVDSASPNAFIGGGNENVIRTNTLNGVIGGGMANIIESRASFATIGGGAANAVYPNSSYATVPGGRNALADHYGQLAYAHGSFGMAGSAQTSIMVPYGSSLNTIVTELFLDGPGGSRRMVLRPGGTWAFDILLTARTTAGQSAAFTLRGVIKNVSGTTTLVGGTTVTQLGAEGAGWSATAVADDPSDALVLRVGGLANTTTRWVASVRTTEVLF